MSIGEFVKTADFKSEKHVPVIVVPEGIKAGEPFVVEVSVGKEIPHPNTTEHFISWISLYFKPAEGPVINLGRFEYSAHGEAAAGANQGPAYAEPVSTCKIKLEKAGTLIATSYCNIHGLWEGSAEVTF
ncbi:Superoxide reductase [Denitrovibrio acetiphilus DSM 12809]|uniref:Superoxide reductase n=1 Tax=Denitrovibrio acetiphilus (strain DSM 12809 / NBRC 114555 / N2460) TaxID=522772 RepID=D4H5Z7_DENA2|nr:class II SORL domain-containing protein [Denitrovibrio acetiphilus]ADD67643.1 Superoxide reductase [Denitrovibrio acetiphilus DSM 12809]